MTRVIDSLFYDDCRYIIDVDQETTFSFRHTLSLLETSLRISLFAPYKEKLIQNKINLSRTLLENCGHPPTHIHIYKAFCKLLKISSHQSNMKFHCYGNISLIIFAVLLFIVFLMLFHKLSLILLFFFLFFLLL